MWPSELMLRSGSSHLENCDECFCKRSDKNSHLGSVTKGQLSLEGFLEPVYLVTLANSTSILPQGEEYENTKIDRREGGEWTLLRTLRTLNGVRMKVVSDIDQDIDALADKSRACWTSQGEHHTPFPGHQRATSHKRPTDLLDHWTLLGQASLDSGFCDDCLQSDEGSSKQHYCLQVTSGRSHKDHHSFYFLNLKG